MKGSIVISAGAALLSPTSCTSADPSSSTSPNFQPYGFQSGHFEPTSQSNTPPYQSSVDSELINDDSFASSMYYDPQHNLIYFTGSTYGTYFDSATDLSREIKGAMGMSALEGGRDVQNPHLENADCFLGILKMPQQQSSNNNNKNGKGFGSGEIQGMSNPAPWLIHVDEDMKNGLRQPELIYARRFGTPQNSETCSSIIMLPKVNDALLQSSAQLKLALLGHVNPAPLSSAEVKAMGPVPVDEDEDIDYFAAGGGERQRQLKGGRNQQEKILAEESRRLGYDGNRGGFLHSLSSSPQPITQPGRAYGFMVDFDLSLTLDETFTAAPSDGSFSNAYGALLGGYVLESSPLVYPVAMTQNKRDPNQIYVVSMHMDNEDSGNDNKIEDMSEAELLNPEYAQHLREELDGTIHYRADMTMGGAGGNGSKLVGGVPKYGTDFYVKVQSLQITPYEQLMDVEPTPDEKVKRTMTSGWGFGFKLNDANDVRPSSIVFVKGRTPNEDLLLLGGTTRKAGLNGGEELDGFITKLIPPAPAPVEDQTFGHSVKDAIDDESVHPTKRIDSTTGRDETVTAICLPPPDQEGMITHAFVVGSTTSERKSQMTGDHPSIAYILKIRLDDLSTVWKEHLPSIHPSGLGGDVLGEGCTVSPDGARVYLSGTIHGGSAVNTGMPNTNVQPMGGLTDVFVMAYDVDFGNVQWAKQLGTAMDDKLARGGGVECDNEGNVIIMGSSRGGLQRYRPDTTQQQQPQRRSVSDVFVMSLSREDGSYVNAPYSGDAPASSSGGTVATSAKVNPGTAAEANEGGGGMSGGAIAGISLIVIGSVAALALFALGRVRRKRQHHYDERDGNVLRGWSKNGGDDFSYDDHTSLGGRHSSNMGDRGGGGGTLRVVRGEDDDWDDGENISPHAAWMPGGSYNNSSADDDSVHSSSSKGSFGNEKTEKNIDFLASLRQEANATMKNMVKQDPDDTNSETEDPRLDGGASIKSLLSHYREVKKGGLFDENDGDAGGGDSAGSSGSKSGKGSGKSNGKKKPPPPPPPRKKKSDDGEHSADGLSEFTII